MSGAFQVGAIALETQQRALDAIANNIANINTPAFKRSEVRFADVVANAADPDVVGADLRVTSDALSGVMLDEQFMLNEQGSVDKTGSPMDLAIEGAGFIELMGASGQTLLWRGGTLKVDADGALTTAAGVPLKAGINVPRDAAAIAIGTDGKVTATTSDGTEPVEIGRIQLVKVDDPSAVMRLDGGLYRLPDDSRVTAADPGEDGAGQLVQGAVERSSVVLTDEMVRMMLVQRAYAANAQIVQAADQLMAIANGLRR